MFTRVAAGLTPILLVLAAIAVTPSTALAYQGCQSQSTISTSQPSGPAGTQITVTVTLKDCSGNAAGGQGVTFTQTGGPAGCTLTISPTSTTTNAQGVATTVVTLPANCPGQFTIQATSPGVVLTAQMVESGGLPAAVGARAPAPSGLPVWLLGLALLAAGGGALALRRLRA